MFFAICSGEVTEVVLFSLQHSVGPQQPCKVFPAKAILPYLTFTFSLITLQKLEVKINMFAGQKGVLIHDIKYEKIQKDQMHEMIIAFVHHTAVNEETGKVQPDDIPK